ncbi:glycosyltransferase family 39 protein [Streptomyces sp. NBC_01476]|uniref:glycosyltransferase family 39 protein n=1 Tax=Streptomyces sp. NBC_01476 TaxID=2903881 RepID=UPI002E3320D0|nr:glycosyltransferase family 39 protein [Streptomyces sp. NBC_01476]
MTIDHLSRPSHEADDSGTPAGPAGAPAGNAFRWMVPVLPGLVTLAFGLWRLTHPALWRDEAATISSAHRSVPELWRMTGNVDAVHGLYYLLMHYHFAVFGVSALSLRLPSVIAGVVTAALIAATGSRLANPRAGLLAGLFWSVLPVMSRYLQEGRSFSMVAMCVAAAAYFLARRKWVPYAVAVAFVGALNVLSVLSLAGFAVGILSWWIQGFSNRREVVRATIATVVALAVGAAPVALRSHSQSSVLDWIPKPSSHSLVDLVHAMSGSKEMVIPLLMVAAYGCWRAFRGNRGRFGGTGHERQLAALALPLAALPPLLLIAYSLVGSPTYVTRYVLYTLIGAAWLAGLGLDALLSLLARLPGRLGSAWNGLLGLVAGTLAVVVVAAFGWPAQEHYRSVNGHGDRLLGLSQVVRENARPGDGVLFILADRRYAKIAYPSYFRETEDLMLASSPASSASLFGEEYPLTELKQRLKGHTRVFVVWSRLAWADNRTDELVQMRSAGYEAKRTWALLPSQQVVLWIKTH